MPSIVWPVMLTSLDRIQVKTHGCMISPERCGDPVKSEHIEVYKYFLRRWCCWVEPKIKLSLNLGSPSAFDHRIFGKIQETIQYRPCTVGV